MKPYLGAAGREGNSSNGGGEYNSLLGESAGDVNTGDFVHRRLPLHSHFVHRLMFVSCDSQ